MPNDAVQSPVVYAQSIIVCGDLLLASRVSRYVCETCLLLMIGRSGASRTAIPSTVPHSTIIFSRLLSSYVCICAFSVDQIQATQPAPIRMRF